MFLLAKLLGGDLADLAKENAASIAQGFDELWNETITGGVYSAICTVGALFAIATLTFFVVEWTKKMMAGEEQRAYTDFIWPLIVIVLLSNKGNVLGKSTLGIRNYINNVNNIVLSEAAAGIDLKKAYESALGTEAARSAIGIAVNKCRNSSLSENEGFRPAFLKKLASITPTGVFNGDTQVSLIPRFISQPRQIKSGKWEIDFIGTLVTFERENNLGKGIAFNKTVTVSSISNPEYIPANTTELAKKIYAARRAGLEITEIVDLNFGRRK